MSSEDVSTIAMDPFISKFVLTIIKTIRKHNLNHEERHVINADIIPRLSESVMHVAIIPERKIPPVKEIELPKVAKHQHRDMSMLVSPIRSRPNRPMHTYPSPPAMQKPRISPAPLIMDAHEAVPKTPMQINHPKDVAPVSPPASAPVSVPVTEVQGEVQLTSDYGKITPLLNDPSVSSIECQGANRQIMIIRAGQREVTRIVLDENDIRGILQKVSDIIHIPLLEGVFRAAADNFSINAVISEMIGSRFVIQKQTPYALLERQF